MGTYSKKILEEDIVGTPFKRIVHNVYNDGACQCYGDCDCYKEKGKLLGPVERFTHPLSTKWFASLANCQSSFKGIVTKRMAQKGSNSKP